MCVTCQHCATSKVCLTCWHLPHTNCLTCWHCATYKQRVSHLLALCHIETARVSDLLVLCHIQTLTCWHCATSKLCVSLISTVPHLNCVSPVSTVPHLKCLTCWHCATYKLCLSHLLALCHIQTVRVSPVGTSCPSSVPLQLTLSVPSVCAVVLPTHCELSVHCGGSWVTCRPTQLNLHSGNYLYRVRRAAASTSEDSFCSYNVFICLA